MFHATPSTRRTVLQRSTLALAVLAPLGARLTQAGRAAKNDGRGPRAIAVKANHMIDECFRGGGEPEVGNVSDTSIEVTCTSGDGGWVSCTITNPKGPHQCSGSGDTAQQLGQLWDLEPLTGATDPGSLAHGGEVAFTLAEAPKSGRTGRARHARKRGDAAA